MIKPSFKKILILWIVFLFIGITTLYGQSHPNVVIDKKQYRSLDYRLIGPYRGGRVTAVDGVTAKPATFYMGTTGGGVWKTTDNGENWNNITDGYLNVGSVGAVAAAPSDPNVVYVGTGSACPRGNISLGDGMYKSTDAGQSWNHIGLPKAGLIGDVTVDPKDPDRIYVAALGNIFGPNPERGVFRSTDGGDNWEKVLFASDSTGAVDLAINPSNPRIIYATMWRAERKPWTLIDGGPEGGVWKTTDGGDTWNQLTNDLPGGVLGRIGVTVSPADPNRVWVLLETDEEKEGGLYRSDDAGKSFTKVNRNHKLRSRAWYYNHVHADPQDPETVYISNAGFYKSTNGGKDFDRVDTPHGDNHDLWINPDDHSIMINANDGGANVSTNGGKTWSTQRNQPTAEFYRVTVDNQFPYRVYGAQQDNSTISVPSWSPGGITPEQYWFSAGGGESGHIAVDPENSDIIYAGSYQGIITRLNLQTGHQRNVGVYPALFDGIALKDLKYRYQWNAPIRISPHNSEVVYHTSQYVHRSSTGGQKWETVSPNLTASNKQQLDSIPGGPIQHDATGVEVYGSIFSFSESSLQQGNLWTGSDDGLVYVSQDNGENWNEVTPDAMPEGGTVNTIDLSHHKEGRAYMAVYKYREADFKPYIFRTENYGEDWEMLTNDENGIPADHFVRVVREDPEYENILYAGTEYGMYISYDRGEHWQPFQQNLPVTPITDLQIQRDDLVVATQGRSFWILDDLSVLRQVAAEQDPNTTQLYQPADGYRTQLSGFGGERVPESPSSGVKIYYSLSEEPDSIRLEILDAAGNVVKSFEEDAEKLSAHIGLNRLVWDLKYPKPNIVDDAVLSFGYTGGAISPPGTYQVHLKIDGEVYKQDFLIEKDPRWKNISNSDLQAQFDLAARISDELEKINDSIRSIRSIRKQLLETSKLAIETGFDSAIWNKADSLAQNLTRLEKKLIQNKSESGQDPINYPLKIGHQLAHLYNVVNGQDARPTEGSYQRYKDLQQEAGTYYEQLNELKKDISSFNTMLKKADVPAIIVKPLENN